MINKLFNRIKSNVKVDAEAKADEKAYHIKTTYMEKVLGREHDWVTHAIVPYNVGGSLDFYYFPNYKNGTAIASKELTDYKFDGPKNNMLDSYELVMVTNQKLDMESLDDESPQENTFSYDCNYISIIMNLIGRYAVEVNLNPYETIEFPADMKSVGAKCLILDILAEPLINKHTGNKKFGLMLIMEIHRDEMHYAMQHGGKNLIELLKEKGVYPFTGIYRKSIFA